MMLESLQMMSESQSAGAYADCQQAAVRIGKFIESEGEGPRTVALLVEYHELLFKASKGAVGIKALKKHLTQVENSVRTELKPNRIEIVFLSYKASMSDSLESIYLAAKADPDCDAYWIPIPYFDRNPGGSFGETRYEGAECYGKNIECVNWRKYDIEARHPDVIFTFNPYDGGNYVTSVHPKFYCERLRNLTDLLVYVPYFVTAGDVEEHFCTAAGCVYAHKVVLQSEKIRDAYVSAFKKHYGDRFGKPEEKFIALGSPKFDKVINTKKEDCELPDGWRGLIANRKVVFYNTTLGTILKDSGQYLKKLCHVLDTFKGRDDVVLWWRPHPLSESTFSSMRPQLFEEYKHIVAEYKREGRGIYDDTVDLHRALAWSDAYYGDWSSLVAMYEVTGKPILIQLVDENDLINSRKQVELSIFDIYDDGAYLWFTAIEFNALFKVDKETGNIKYVGSFPGERRSGWRLYTTINENNGKLYFTPCSAVEIGVYDINNDRFEKINIGINSEENDVTQVQYLKKFASSFIQNDKLYLIPCCYNKSIVYDIATGIVSADENMFLSFKSRYGEHTTSLDSQFYFCWLARKINKSEIVFNLHCNKNIAVRLCLESGDFNEYKVSGEHRTYTLVECGGDYIWLYDASGDTLVRWNKTNNEYDELVVADHIPQFKACGLNSSFVNMVIFAQHLFLIPANTNLALKVNIHTMKISVVGELTDECSIIGEGIVFSNLSRVIGNRLYLYSNRSGSIVEYDEVAGNLRKVKITLPDGGRSIIERGYLLDSLLDGYAMFGEGQISLANFLDTLNSREYGKNESLYQKSKLDSNDKSAGEKIYEYAKQTALNGVK
uniref:CDP-glycerol:poly(Glycerophosphate) glycerophosphotransferase n=1 Tax=uncultured bacterium contig00009 TaxID=1181501 RepID=A0A806JZT8_9BACT|nr:CDP-glycerol:poly(glycerophosphate) glycerophosphotransferase [uncultured bacterium contig00009]